MLFRAPVQQIPSNDHIRLIDSNIRDHVSAMSDIQSDLKDFFQRSLYKYSQTSPEDLKPIYTKFIQSGVKYAVSFGKFIKKFSPTLKTISNLEQKYEIVSRQFSLYCDDVKAVRNDELPAIVEEEKRDLLRFVKSFTEYNNDSNSFLVCFLALYVMSINQLAADTQLFLQSITQQIEEFQPAGETKEEKDLDKLISKLEKEVEAQKKRSVKPVAKSESQKTPQDQQKETNQEKEETKEKPEQEKSEENKQNDAKPNIQENSPEK